jgi:hypothetical protein
MRGGKSRPAVSPASRSGSRLSRRELMIDGVMIRRIPVYDDTGIATDLR